MILFLTLTLGILLPGAYLTFNPQFGGVVTRRLKKIYARSEQWNGNKFENLSPTTMDLNIRTFPKMLYSHFNERANRTPKRPLEIMPFDKAKFEANPEQACFVWYGHSTLLLKLNGKNILIDPMFGSNASPVGPANSSRFSENTLTIIDQLPPIDAVLFTHDHYDHLDYESVLMLKDKVDTYFVALGVSRHLELWGVRKEQITEFDWWEEADWNGIKFVFTPSRHFAGRGLFDRAQTLWGGWVMLTDKHRIYWSGDGGYDQHFELIGKKYGPFDWAFMECGQYNELWRQLHMFPDESIRAAADVQAKLTIPVHWGGFTLSTHSWKDPAERFKAAAVKENIPACTPKLGEVVTMGHEPQDCEWYTEIP